MAVRKKYETPAVSNESTSFLSKYGLKKQAGLESPGDECFVIPLDMSEGYVSIPCHTLKKSIDGTGFKNSKYNATISCHKYDKNTGEVVDQLPLCCRIAQMEKERIADREQSSKRAISFTSETIVIPVMVLSSTEDKEKKPSLRKISAKSGVSFSFLKLSSSAYDKICNDIKSDLETTTDLDIENLDREAIAAEIAKYLQSSVIKISCIEPKSPNLPHEKTYKVIPLNNLQVAKDSGEQKFLSILAQVVNGVFPADKLDDLYAKSADMKAICTQTIDYLTLFNSEIDTIATDWTDEELQEYYNAFLEKQGVVSTYATQATVKEQETVTFTEPEPVFTSLDEFNSTDDDLDTVASSASVATATATSEDDFDYDTSDLEESAMLDEFDEDDFGLEDGEEL